MKFFNKNKIFLVDAYHTISESLSVSLKREASSKWQICIGNLKTVFKYQKSE